jgi:hypothetical protein
MRNWIYGVGIALAASALCATSAPAASYNPIDSGATRVTIDRDFLKVLKTHGVKVQAAAGAKLQSGTVRMPVVGGEVDPVASKGTIENDGMLIFRSSRRSVKLQDLTLKSKSTPLLAKVGGSQLKVARAKTVEFTRSGFGEKVRIEGLVLSQKAVTRLNKKLGLGTLLHEGQPFGRITAAVQPATVGLLPEGQVRVTPDPAFMAKLGSLFVAVNPIFPTEAQGGAFTFPIGGGGAIAPDTLRGVLRTEGNLEFLQLSGGQIFWNDPALEMETSTFSADEDIEPSPPFPGKLGRSGILGFERSGSVTAQPQSRAIAVGGFPLRLSAATADSFNQAFAAGAPTFTAGEKVADLAFAANAR